MTPTKPTSAASEALRDAHETVKRSKQVISKVFLDARLGKSVNLSAVENVVDDIYQTVGRHEFALAGLLRCRDDKSEVYRHALAVSALMVGLAKRMKLPPAQVRAAGFVGLMCDIGVGQIPSSLDAFGGDYRALRSDQLDQHVYFGHDLLADIDELSPDALSACLQHHERLDGSGYPYGLRDGQISQLARMIAICDEFDYLVSGGFQKPPIEPVDAVEQLRSRSEKFDHSIMTIFAETIGVYPIGTFVELASGRVAMVVGISLYDAATPTVRAFYCKKSGSRIRNQTIDLSCSYGADSISGVAQLDGYDLPPVDYLRARLLTAAYK